MPYFTARNFHPCRAHHSSVNKSSSTPSLLNDTFSCWSKDHNSQRLDRDFAHKHAKVLESAVSGGCSELACGGCCGSHQMSTIAHLRVNWSNFEPGYMISLFQPSVYGLRIILLVFLSDFSWTSRCIAPINSNFVKISWMPWEGIGLAVSEGRGSILSTMLQLCHDSCRGGSRIL